MPKSNKLAYLLAMLLSAFSIKNADSEMVVNWDSLNKNVNRCKLENIIKFAAEQYQREKYADLGVVDFERDTARISINFVKEGNSKYEPLDHTIYLKIDEFDDEIDILTNVFHEFSHAYDHLKNRLVFYEISQRVAICKNPISSSPNKSNSNLKYKNIFDRAGKEVKASEQKAFFNELLLVYEVKDAYFKTEWEFEK